MMELASIKTAIYQHGTVQEIRLVPGHLMAADGLTKKGRETLELSNILKSGRHFPPNGGFKFRGTADIPRKVWASLEAMPKGKSFRCSRFVTEEHPGHTAGEIDDSDKLDFAGNHLEKSALHAAAEHRAVPGFLARSTTVLHHRAPTGRSTLSS